MAELVINITAKSSDAESGIKNLKKQLAELSRKADETRKRIAGVGQGFVEAAEIAEKGTAAFKKGLSEVFSSIEGLSTKGIAKAENAVVSFGNLSDALGKIAKIEPDRIEKAAANLNALISPAKKLAQASIGIDNFAAALGGIPNAMKAVNQTSKGVDTSSVSGMFAPLTQTANAITRLTTDRMQDAIGGTALVIRKLGEAIQTLGSGSSKIYDMAKGIEKLPDALRAFNGKNFTEQIKYLAANLRKMSEIITVTGDNPILNPQLATALFKLGEGLKSLNKVKIDESMAENLVRAGEAVKQFAMSVPTESIDGIVATTDSISKLANSLGKIADIKDISNLGKNMIQVGNAVKEFGSFASTIDVSGTNNVREVLKTISAITRMGADKNGTLVANIDSASNAIRRFIESMTNFPDSVILKLERVSNALEKISRQGIISARAFSNHTKEMVKGAREATKYHGAMSKIGAAFKRILMYRVIRGLIATVTRTMKEGLKNLYEWSREVESLDVYSVKAAMDDLASSWGQMKNQLGVAFFTIIAELKPVLDWLMNAFYALGEAISYVFALLSGKDQYVRAKRQNLEWAESADKASKSGKELQKTLLGFDEINRLNDNNGSGSDLPDYEGMFETVPVEEYKLALDGLGRVTDRLKELIGSLDFEPMLEGWNDLKTAAQELADTIGEGLGWAWDNILVPLAHWTIEEAIPTTIELLAKAFGLLNAVFEKLGPILEPLWNNVLKPFFKWLGEVSMKGLEELIDLLDDLTKLINGEISWKEFVDGLDGVQIALLALGGLAVLSAISKVIGAVWRIPASIGLATPKATTALGKMANAVAVGALAVFDAVVIAYDVAKLSEVADTYHETQLAYNNEMDTALDDLAKLYENCDADIIREWGKMAYDLELTGTDMEEDQRRLTEEIERIWGDTPRTWWEAFKQNWDKYFGVHGSGIKGLFTDAWNGFADFYGLGKIETHETQWYDVPPDTHVFSDGTKHVFSDGAWHDPYKNVGLEPEQYGPFLDPAGNAVEYAVIPDFVWNIPGIDIKPSADGGLYDSGTMFLAGEAGPEVVANIGGRSGVMNVEQMADAIAEGNTGVERLLGELIRAVNSKELDVKLDGRSIADSTTKYQRQTARAMG